MEVEQHRSHPEAEQAKGSRIPSRVFNLSGGVFYGAASLPKERSITQQ
jgi:hypothetical protein